MSDPKRRTFVMADLDSAQIPRLEVTPAALEELKRRFTPAEPKLLGHFGASLGFGGIAVYVVDDLPVPWRLVGRKEEAADPPK